MLRILICAAFAAAATTPLAAQTVEEAAPRPPSIEIELNRLQTVDSGCRPYFVVRNGLDARLDTLQLDVFLFDRDGIIMQGLTLPFEDVPEGRRKVFPFELQLACGEIGSIFVNGVLSCTAGGDAVPGCGGMLSMSQRTEASFGY
jgi:hypothetical protein